jgi:16S rRNA A1518/A1519 N6-dimethyltransferase RsmA/KsgA/DIM1 with predicted DNA glycosylase/AP lyase activity
MALSIVGISNDAVVEVGPGTVVLTEESDMAVDNDEDDEMEEDLESFS